MSKVLVDRELLERAMYANDGKELIAANRELRAILAQPAEVEGVELVPFWVLFDATTPEPLIKKHMPEGVLAFFDNEEDARRAKALHPGTDYKRAPYVRAAALSAVTAERDSLLQFKAAHLEWHEKTEWVQETAQVHELGKHRADVLKDRIDQLRAEVEMMREDAERWRYVSLQGDDTHWLNLLRVDLEDFGGNINAAVDALIDGDTPVTAAKEA